MKKIDAIKCAIFIAGIVVIFLFSFYQAKTNQALNSNDLYARGLALENSGRYTTYMILAWCGGWIAIFLGKKRKKASP